MKQPEAAGLSLSDAFKRVTDTPIHLAYRACRPFMVGLLIWLALISFVPALSLLPVKFFGP